MTKRLNEHMYLYIEHMEMGVSVRGILLSQTKWSTGIDEVVEMEGDAQDIIDHIMTEHPEIRHLELIDKDGEVIETGELSTTEVAQIMLDNELHQANEGPHGRNE